jgi:hypothetical protein
LIPTKAKLANAIRAFAPDGHLEAMAKQAEAGHYDDFESPLEAPCVQLVRDLRAAGAEDLAKRAMNGEWDATKAESDAWANSPRGRAALSELSPGMREALGGPPEGDTARNRRAPQLHPTSRGHAPALEEIASKILMSATEFFCAKAKQEAGASVTGFSFVTLAVRLWAQELGELDRSAARDYLRACADLAAADNVKVGMAAERRREEAWDRLQKALDLTMAEPGGNA